jgi:hypothetical protein
VPDLLQQLHSLLRCLQGLLTLQQLAQVHVLLKPCVRRQLHSTLERLHTNTTAT